jgi:hypothetical protein
MPIMNEPPDDYEHRQRINLLAAAAVAVLVIASLVLMVSLRQGIQRENCFAAGHRTCAPIDEH